MLTYLTCFLFYIAFPVYGPRAMAAGTAFPSSHVAGVVTMAVLGWRWLGRGWGLVMAVAALAVTLSTVYTGNHYVVDAMVGALWVVPFQAWIQPYLERRDAGLSRRADTGAPRSL